MQEQPQSAKESADQPCQHDGAWLHGEGSGNWCALQPLPATSGRSKRPPGPQPAASGGSRTHKELGPSSSLSLPPDMPSADMLACKLAKKAPMGAHVERGAGWKTPALKRC